MPSLPRRSGRQVHRRNVGNVTLECANFFTNPRESPSFFQQKKAADFSDNAMQLAPFANEFSSTHNTNNWHI
jgi:hypothetical protein